MLARARREFGTIGPTSESEYCVVLVTVPDAKTAQRISRRLVERKLAACVSEIGGVRSRYRWEGKVETAQESLLLAKTRSALVPALAQAVRALHPYAVPEIIALPIAGAHAPYLDWIGANTRFAPTPQTTPAR